MITYAPPLLLFAAAIQLDALSSIFGITTVVAAALAGLTWGTVKTLRDTANDLRARVKDLEEGRENDKAELAELRSENAALGRLVTGEVHWQALTDLLNQHHVEAREHWDRTLVSLTDIDRHIAQGLGQQRPRPRREDSS